jgi:hypothetical protein
MTKKLALLSERSRCIPSVPHPEEAKRTERPAERPRLHFLCSAATSRARRVCVLREQSHRGSTSAKAERGESFGKNGRRLLLPQGSYANLCPGSMALASPEDALFSFQLVFPSPLFSCRRFFHVRVSSFSTLSHFPSSPPCIYPSCIHPPLSFPHHSIFVSNCENCLSLLRKMFRCSHH